MLPVEAVDIQLHAARASWLTAVKTEDRAAEAAAMQRLNRLLEQRTSLASSTRPR